ncbi:MAG: hypothetical protein Q4F29_13600 [Lachnospiraceae bacterium]|nr:hypothetical protein [Lachnospiraceae bacterium]
MSLKLAKKICFIFILVAFVFASLLLITQIVAFAYLVLGIAGIYIIFELKFWRCPACNKNLGSLWVKHCPICGEKLDV